MECHHPKCPSGEDGAAICIQTLGGALPRLAVYRSALRK